MVLQGSYNDVTRVLQGAGCYQVRLELATEHLEGGALADTWVLKVLQWCYKSVGRKVRRAESKEQRASCVTSMLQVCYGTVGAY
jgi:hypothetical protein